MRPAVSYLFWLLLAPVFYFIDDWLSKKHGWSSIALLPAQIEITIFIFLNGKIFGSPGLNCTLKKSTIRENMNFCMIMWRDMIMWREAETKKTFTRGQNVRVDAFQAFSLSSARIQRPEQHSCEVFINKHCKSRLAAQTSNSTFSALSATSNLKKQ